MKIILNNAATLLECSIYLGCSALLSLLIFSFSSQTYRYFVEVRNIFCTKLREELALDVVRRDLLSATRCVGNYVPDRFIFKKEFIDESGVLSSCFVGWERCNDGVKRIEGDYDVTAMRWRRRIVSKLPARFSFLYMVLILDKQCGDVRGCIVTWMTEGGNERHQEYVAIGAGVV